jgi:ComF family protein
LTQIPRIDHFKRALCCDNVLNAIWPPRCAGCGFWHQNLFCDECSPQLKFILSHFCYSCGLPFDPLAKATVCRHCRANRYQGVPSVKALRSVWQFEGPVREAVHRLKYHGKTALSRPLGQQLWAFLQHEPGLDIPLDDIDLVVPVPLHAWRQWRRGYNQSTLLARELAILAQKPCVELLWRRRHTGAQVELSAQQRQENIKGAFALDTKLLKRLRKPRAVLLIDDVCTTGSTLYECARVLQTARIETVYALTLARQL